MDHNEVTSAHIRGQMICDQPGKQRLSLQSNIPHHRDVTINAGFKMQRSPCKLNHQATLFILLPWLQFYRSIKPLRKKLSNFFHIIIGQIILKR